MATTYCYYTQTTPTDNNTWTLSMWVKRGVTGTVQNLAGAWDDGSNHCIFRFNADNQLDWYDYQDPASFQLKTNRQFRDVGAWYHLVFVWDSDNVTEADRMQTWVNGVRETSFATADYPTSGAPTVINVSGRVVEIGRRSDGGYFSGEMSWVQFVDGLALAPTAFGGVDATSGIWKINPGAYATPGDNGFCLAMEDRTNLDLDTSSNAFTFTTSGTLTATYDNPSNNFATMNALDNDSSTFTNGNTTLTWTVTNKTNKSTLGMEGGKWYAECKGTDVNGGVSGTLIGVGTADNVMNTYLSSTNSGWGYRCQTGEIQNGAGNEAYGDTYTDGDIIGVAIDMDNGYVYMSKNGVWQDSGDPTSGASGTGAANNQPTYGSVLSGTQFFACSSYDTDVLSWNFGNGYFATTSSGTTEADDAGIGQFKYDVPAGFYALCTKNIKVYG